MTTFSAWIRVPGHRVLRCGSLQIKSEKNCRFVCTPCCWGQGFGGSPEYWPQNGARPSSVREHMYLNHRTPEMTHLPFGLAFLGKLTKL